LPAIFGGEWDRRHGFKRRVGIISLDVHCTLGAVRLCPLSIAAYMPSSVL
jgi:hypothetical protein